METSDEIITLWLLARLPRAFALSISVSIIVLGIIAAMFLICCGLVLAVKSPGLAFGVAVGFFIFLVSMGLYKAMDKEMPRREKKS